MVKRGQLPAAESWAGLDGFRKERKKNSRAVPPGVAGFKRVHLKNPFSLLTKLLESIVPETNTILLDFHAVTTAEKATMFAMADGILSAVIGTHTKGLTADERVLPDGTAVITDAVTGSLESVAGLDPEIEIRS